MVAWYQGYVDGTAAKHQASYEEDLPHIEFVGPLYPQINHKPDPRLKLHHQTVLQRSTVR